MLAQFIADNIWFVAAAWMGLALLASLISIRLGVSVALIEIGMGVIGGNFLGFQTTPWIDFLATFGSGLLTFLAGAEIEPESLRRSQANTGDRLAVFLSPVCWRLAVRPVRGGLGAAPGVDRRHRAVDDVGGGGVRGHDRDRAQPDRVGKMILAGCFVTDFGTVLALGVLFANFNGFLVLFVVVLAVSLYFMPRWTRFVIKNVGNRVSEPEIKFIFFMLFLLGGFATAAKSEAVLPAYLVGLVIAGVFVRDKVLVNRMRSIAFALLTPFYFLKAGLFVSLPAVAAGAGLSVALLLVKMATKALVVWPSAKAFRFTTRESNYTTLLMSTGLTFGTISALFGLTNRIIKQTQC